MATLHFRDRAGDGALTCPTGIDGSVDYDTGDVTAFPFALVPIKVPQYTREDVGTRIEGEQEITDWRRVLTGFEDGQIAYYYDAGEVSAEYLPASATGTAASETVTLDTLRLDMTPGFAEQIVRGSLRFTLGGSVYIDRAGVLYRDPSPETGAGAVAGTLDPSTGSVRITDWLAGGSNAVALNALLTQVGSQPIDQVMFRVPVSPIKSGAFQLRWSSLDGTAYSKQIDSSGYLEDGDCTVEVDYYRGVVKARFGRWIEVADLTPEDLAADWYDAGAVVTVGDVDQIWRPVLVQAETILYNAVAQTYLPPDSNLLGLDAAKLPPDGQALIFRRGQLVLIHHTDDLPIATLSPTQVIDCERVRLYRVEIEDSAGALLGADQYTLNRELGTVTMGASLDTSGFTPPWTVRHTVADLGRLIDTDINGRLTLMAQLTHAYPATGAYCSGVLFAGTLQARVSNLFAQSAWTSVWADAVIGSEPLAQYNDAIYPITVTNAGAYPDRFLIKFTSATAFQVIGENLGLIGIGDITTDCEPINSLTEEPYFRIDYRGWGSGWATGHCLRFNLLGACYPIDLVRAVQPSQASGLVDQVQLLLIGNVDSTG